jgi:RNA polymerase sigma factor (sigma-70 family)
MSNEAEASLSTDGVAAYLADIERTLMQHTAADRAALHARMRAGDGRARLLLWEDALRLVLLIEGRLRKQYGIEQPDLDMIQEGNIAAGKAVETWDPSAGAFSTWIVAAVRGRMLDYLNEAAKGGIGSKSAAVVLVDMDEVVASASETSGGEDRPGMQRASAGFTRGELLTYDGVVVAELGAGDDAYAPEGYGTPTQEAYRQQVRHAVEFLTLPADRDILSRYFGFNGEPNTLAELAEAYNMSLTGARKRLLAAVRRVQKFL